MSQKERVRTKRAVDYGRACRRRVPELPYPVCKRNREERPIDIGPVGVNYFCRSDSLST